jgi:hypothetical protein
VNGQAATARWRLDWLAVLTFGLASLWLFGIGSLLALATGRQSLRRSRMHPELRGRTVAWSGVAVAILGLAWAAVWIVLAVSA